MPKFAVIAGSTGLVGSHCLQFLLSSPEYASVRALVRRPTGVSHPKLHEQTVDFDSLANLPHADHVFCALGTTIRKAGSQSEFRRVDLEYPLRLAESVLSAGAQQFVLVSSVGANSKSGNFYLRTKGELEEALRQQLFAGLHIFRPSFLLGMRSENRPGERIGMALAKPLSFVMVGGLRKYRPITAETVGKAMVNAASVGTSGTHVYEYEEIISLAQ